MPCRDCHGICEPAARITSQCAATTGGSTYHKPPCRKLLLFALVRARKKYAFRLYGLCIMSNHVHYLLEPADPNDLPRIMHWLNWYTAMCFNRMLDLAP